MSKTLLSVESARKELANFFLEKPGDPVSMYIHEDKCFKSDVRLEIGRVTLFPDPLANSSLSGAIGAVANGFYSIKLDSFESLVDRSQHTIFIHDQFRDEKKIKRQHDKTKNAIKFISSIFTRVGLLHPHFDADAISRMPFRSPGTIICDTSAIQNGGLDFVARALYPIARIKVPAIVHMEIINDIDNYFNYRRQESIRPGEALLSHVKGIGGQRVLLRLELQEDLEVERSSIFQEPLRNTFTRDPDADSSLNITAPVRSFADRLILESARQHQAQVSPGHQVYLMTSDQGLARMALAEGFLPLFFEVMQPADVFGNTLSGVVYSPFDGQLRSVPLSDLIWELAACFGCAGLQADDGRYIQVAAIGSDLPWQPFHSKEDLLWFSSGKGDPGRLSAPAPSRPLIIAAESFGNREDRTSDRGRRPRSDTGVQVPPLVPRLAQSRSDAPSYKFSAGELLKLASMFIDRETIDRARIAQFVGVKEDQVKAYLGFLKAGGFVEIDGQNVSRTEFLVDLVQSMRSRDYRGIGALLRRVASFDNFIEELVARRVVSDNELKSTIFWKLPNYRRYGEAIGKNIYIPGEGLFATPNDLPAEEFADVAVHAYESLVQSAEDYILTGAWLEQLVRVHGVHPLVARERLGQAQAARLLNRYTRGATPDTRFEDHAFHVIEPTGAGVQLIPVALYHGDFLIPERTSVELRIERLANEPQ